MPVGNGGKFTQESREIYELVLEMQTVCGPRPCYLSCHALTLTHVGLLQGDQTRLALGRSTAVVPQHTRARFQEAWNLQSRRRRGGDTRSRRKRGVLPARRRPFAGSRRTRRAEREQACAQPDDRAR